MSIEIETSYWILDLRVSSLRLVLKHAKKANIQRVTYIRRSRPAKLMLKLLTRLGVKFPPLHHVEAHHSPSGPRLYLASVRKENGEVIIFDVFHRVLELRRKLLTETMEQFADTPFPDALDAPNMAEAAVGLQMAEDINEAVFIANYAHHQQGQHVLVIPRTAWSGFLAESLQLEMDQVLTAKRDWKRSLKNLLLVLKRMTTATIKGGRAVVQTPDHNGGKILATYAMGIFDGQRNDISYFHAADMEPERMAFYFKYNDLVPSEAELKWLKDNDVTCFAAEGMTANIPGVPKWRPSPLHRTLLKQFYTFYRRAFWRFFFGARKSGFRMLDIYWQMGLQTAYWKDFFINNHISIAVHQVPAANNFIPNLALSAVGGTACIMERSILFDYCTFIHNSPNHINFVTGPYSLTQIPEPSFSSLTVQTGALNVGDKEFPIEGFDALRERSEIILSVFDEMPNPWFFGDSVAELYRAMIELVDSDSRFGLLIKSKKPQVLERLDEAREGLERLQSEGKCVIADWKVTAHNAAAHSDVVVLVPSTVAFESVLTGKRTILYNPMRAGSNLFYTNDGLNRRVFEDGELMKAALVRLADSGDEPVGDCSDLISEIDPYNDRRGAERMGQYLQWCLEAYDEGLERDQALEKANDRYTQEWGASKLNRQRFLEVQEPFSSKKVLGRRRQN